MERIKIEDYEYVVCGQNGIILTDENGTYATDIKKAKVFPTMGEAMRVCIKCNYETPFFKVVPVVKGTLPTA